MPRIAFQVFESQITSLSSEEKANFPICQYKPTNEIINGIFSSEDEFKKQRNTFEFMIYTCGNGQQFVIYCCNIFSTIIFVQECLKRFGKSGDCFVLTYSEKEEKDSTTEQSQNNDIFYGVSKHQFNGYRSPYSEKLIESKNIIFRGAPGTGKTYLAKKIATDIISHGSVDDYTMLSEEEKKQIEFIQFHPSYDYSDFVEGLRPKINSDGTMGFELQDGIFKRFVDRARKNYENSQKSKEIIEKELSVQYALTNFFSSIEFDVDVFKTINGNEFTITSVDDEYIKISIPKNANINELNLNINDIKRMLESDEKFEKVRDITNFFGKKFATQAYSYYFVIYNEIRKNNNFISETTINQEEMKKYIFIIDEINRGEISKIFGELFFSIDPGYRGKSGEVSTQYSNLHSEPNNKFYIPENVYIIGRYYE